MGGIYGTDIDPFLNTFNFPLGKLRAGLDLVIPPIKIENDISVGEFFRKRLGNEMLENLIEPLWEEFMEQILIN